VLFVLASTAQILLLANDPHGGEYLKTCCRQILWVSMHKLLRAAVLTPSAAGVFKWRERLAARFLPVFA